MIGKDPRLASLLGPWRLLKPLGAGGMGTVYLAERADQQFQMRVAVKIVRFGMDSEGMLRRFVRERQILAELQHPNIARLLDGGVTADGFPYLVMELVEGDRIDVCCRERNLSVMERLYLFRKVCSAVRYLHSHMIVHRDLKPANILVKHNGEPMVLDFGIANLADDAESDAQTAILFTPKYTSPEQAQSKPVSTRGDVYSLGVILHELLTGQSPYGSDDRTPLEMLRAVELFEPAAPSRSVTDAALARELSGDIDQIVLKALRKAPEERYASVEQLDEDIGRYMDGSPVLAQKQTFEYRMRKFVRRNVGLVVGVVLLVVILVGGSAATLYQARVAQKERDKAERRFDQVRELARLILFDFHDRVQRLPGSTELQRELVDKTLEHLEGLSKEAAGDPKLMAELAESYLRLGDVQGNPYSQNLGETGKAVKTYSRALALLASVSEGSGPPELEHVRAKLYRERGLMSVTLNARHEAKGDLEKAVGIFEGLVKRYPDKLEHRMELASTIGAVADSKDGNSWARAASANEIIEAYNRALAEWREVLRRQPNNSRAQRGVAICLFRIGRQENDEDSAKALARFQAARTQLDSMAEKDKQALEWRRLSGMVSMSEALALTYLKRFPEALEVYSRQINDRRALLAADPENSQALFDLFNTIKLRGDARLEAEQWTEALVDYGEAAGMLEKILVKDPKDRGRKDNYSEVLLREAIAHVKLGHLAEAERNGRRSLALRKELADDPGADAQAMLIYAFTLLEVQPESIRQPKEAMVYYLKAKASGKPVPKDLDKWIAELQAQLR